MLQNLTHVASGQVYRTGCFANASGILRSSGCCCLNGFDKDGYPQITSVSVGGMRISWGCHQLYYWGDDEAKCFSRWLGHQNEGTWWLSLIIHGESRWLDLMILPFYPYLSLVASLFRTCAMLMGYPYQIRVFTWEASGGNSEFPDSWPTLDHLTDPGGCVRLVLNYPAW